MKVLYQQHSRKHLIGFATVKKYTSKCLLKVSRVQRNPGFFKKKAQPSGFFGFYWVFLDKQEKIGKVTVTLKLSNLKP